MEYAACTASEDDGPCNICTRMEDIDVQIVQLENRIASLRAQRRALHPSRNASHDRLVRRLPLEIVSRIFQDYVDMHFDDNSSPFPPDRMEDAPLQLGAVCNTWRTIAWASPRLWTRMSVIIFRRGHESVSELALQWLGRSGQLPLSICLHEDWHAESLDHNHNWSNPDEQVITSLMRNICKFSSRWQALDICLPSTQFRNDIYQYSEIDSHGFNLRHLRVRRVQPRFIGNLFGHFRPKPSPTYVFMVEIPTDCLDIDWSNATTVKANKLTFRESLQVLRASVCLRKFQLGGMSLTDGDPQFFSPIMIPTLRSLCLSYRLCSIILDRLTVPLLEEIDLFSDQESILSLTSLVRRSHCQLQSLRCHSAVTDEILLLLQMTPSLRYLSFKDYSSNANAESLIKYLATPDALVDLPYLERLHFSISLQQPLSWEAIPDIFDPGRSCTGYNATSARPCLQRQSLDFLLDIRGDPAKLGYIDTTSLHRISELVERGINITLRFSDIKKDNSWKESDDFVATSLAFHYPDREI